MPPAPSHILNFGNIFTATEAKMWLQMPGKLQLSPEMRISIPTWLRVNTYHMDNETKTMLEFSVIASKFQDTIVWSEIQLIDAVSGSSNVWGITGYIDRPIYDQHPLALKSGEQHWVLQDIFLLGQRTLERIDGAHDLDIFHALILREDKGLWSLSLPWDIQGTVELDGQTCVRGKRYLILPDSTLRLNSVTLSVVQYDPTLNFPVAVPNFGRVDNFSEITLPIQIHNISNNPKRLELRSLESWIDVLESKITIGANQSDSFTIKLNSRARGALEQGVHFGLEGLEIGTSDEFYQITPMILSSWTNSSIRCEPALIQGGALDYGTLDGAKLVLTLYNETDDDWQGHVETPYDWLDLEYYDLFIPALSQVQLSLRLNQRANYLSVNEHTWEDALLFYDIDKNEELAVTLRLTIREPYAHLILNTAPPIALGIFQEGILTGRDQNVPVYNEGYSPWIGYLRSHVSWLASRDILIEPNSQGYCPIVFTEEANTLLPGIYNETVMTLEGMNQSMDVDIFFKIIIDRNRARLNVSQANFGEINLNYAKAVSSIPSLDIMIRNVGLNKWEGNIESTIPWVRISKDTLIVDGDRSTSIKVIIFPDLSTIQAPLIIDEPNAIRFTDSDGNNAVSGIYVEFF